MHQPVDFSPNQEEAEEAAAPDPWREAQEKHQAIIRH